MTSSGLKHALRGVLGGEPEVAGFAESEGPGLGATRPFAVPSFAESLLQAALLRPDRLAESDAPWVGHIPFAFWIIAAHRPRVLVELGTYSGNSYCAFCQAAAQLDLDTACYAVDTWAGDPQGGFYGEEVYEELRRYHDARYSAFSRLVRSTFDDALDHFADGSIDLLHIDGYHTYDAVRHDFEAWLPKLSSRGIVLFHDINVRERDFGAWRLWQEVATGRPHFAFLHSHGLGVLAVGGDLAAPVWNLLEARPEAIRHWFATAARSIQSEFELTRMRPLVQHRAELESALQERIAEREAARAAANAVEGELQRLRAELESALQEQIAEREAARAAANAVEGELQRLRAVELRLDASLAAADLCRTELAGEVNRSVREREQTSTTIQKLHAERAQLLDTRAFLLRQLHKERRRRQRLRRTISWRATRPLRFVGTAFKRLARGGERALESPEPVAPQRPQVTAADRVPSPVPESARAVDLDYSLKLPLPCVAVPPRADGPVAAIVHMYYPELAVEFRSYLRNIPGPVDIFISATAEFDREVIEKAFSGWSKGSVEVRVVPNRGRDISPKLLSFRDVYDSHPYVLHLHTKRSDHASILAAWRHFLLETLLGDDATVSSIFAIFEHNPRLGIIASQHFEPMRHWINWGQDFNTAVRLAARMGLEISRDGVLDFPAGSMFWARSAALRPLLDLALSVEDFEEEAGQIDGTLAHAIERLYFFACERAGFDWIKVARPEFFAHTPSIVAVRDRRELDLFFARHVFRLLDPGGVRPRTAPLPPLRKVATPLLDSVQDHALGCSRAITAGTRVAIGLVTYNNKPAALRLGFDAARLALAQVGLPTERAIWILDNGSPTDAVIFADETAVRLPSRGNVGFGAGHNLLMKEAFANDAEIYIAVNPDGAMHPDAAGALVRMVQANANRALVEALQFPMEHPKPYDPLTLETPWVSGACLAIPRQAFDELGGFDESFFMYCEDVDLSWRARASGFALKICPQALFLHAVTNRQMDRRTVGMIYGSGIVLARRWGASAFESWLRTEMTALNLSLPNVVIEPVPADWHRYANFEHHFSFAKPRW